MRALSFLARSKELRRSFGVSDAAFVLLVFITSSEVVDGACSAGTFAAASGLTALAAALGPAGLGVCWPSLGGGGAAQATPAGGADGATAVTLRVTLAGAGRCGAAPRRDTSA